MSCKTLRDAKKSRLLHTSFDDKEAQEYRERQVERAESKYIARFFKNFVEQHLQFAPSSIGTPVQTRNGALTAFLRTRWGLRKLRSEGDTHHALDAIVVACATQAMVTRIGDYSKRGELWQYDQPGGEAYLTIDTHSGKTKEVFQKKREHARKFPEPWGGFREDVASCLKDVFVSRPPRTGISGEAHAATIHSRKPSVLGHTRYLKRITLDKLTTKNLEDLIGKDDKNRELYEALRKRLEAYGKDGSKAFEEPFWHPSVIPPQLVRKVTLLKSGSGVRIRGGLAPNSRMLRTDVFTKGSKFYLVPVYPKHRLDERLPDRAAKVGKDEADWLEIDASFEFCFSLHLDDMVMIQKKKDAEPWYGYFTGTNRSDASITVKPHDCSQSKRVIRIGGAESATVLQATCRCIR